jgi:hypothetical protein
MGEALIWDLLELVPNRCQEGCDGNYGVVWINEVNNHRTICKCECKYKETLVRAWEPEANVVVVEQSSSPQEKILER